MKSVDLCSQAVTAESPALLDPNIRLTPAIGSKAIHYKGFHETPLLPAVPINPAFRQSLFEVCNSGSSDFGPLKIDVFQVLQRL